MSEISSTTDSSTAYTPSTTDDSTVNEPSTGFHPYTVPWPGNKYIIIERASRRAITLTASGVSLEQISEQSVETGNRWLCVESGGYFGFINAKSSTYLGHNNFAIHAIVTRFKAWESFTVRAHPQGGYQLLMPHWLLGLKVVTVARDGHRLEARDHGDTCWEFIQV